MRKLELRTEVLDKVVHTSLSGEVDASNAVTLKQSLEQAAERALQALMVDLSGVRRMDSAGAAVLLEVQGGLRRTGRRMLLVSVPESIQQMLEVYGVFELCADLAEGLRRTKRLDGAALRLHDPTKPIRA